MARVWGFDGLRSGRDDDVKQATARAKAIDQSLRLRLYSGLRQSGSRFAAVIRRGAEAPLYLEAAANHEGMRVGSVCPSFARSGVFRMGSRICGELRKAVVLRTMPTHAMRLHEWGTRQRPSDRFALWFTRQDVPLCVLRARRVMVLPLKSVPANNRESRPRRKSGL